MTTNELNKHGWFAVIALLVIGSVIYGWIASYNLSITGFSDSIDYLYMADFYRGYLFGSDVGNAAAHYGTTRFPPVFPLVLAIFGGGTDEQRVASIVGCVIAVLAAMAVYWWARVDLGTRVAPFLIALALLVYPTYFLVNLFPVSEPLSILLLACAFALTAQPAISRSALITAALVIGLAPLARTATLPVLAAFGIWLLLKYRQSPRTLMLPLVVAWSPILFWFGYRSLIAADSYTAYLTLDRISEELGGWPDALWLQPLRLFLAAVENWGTESNPLTWAGSAVVIAMSAYGCLLRLLANKLDAWFFGGYVALILVWPYPVELGRFLVVVYPLALVSCVSAMERLAEQIRIESYGSFSTLMFWGFSLTVAATNAPAAVTFFQRSLVPVDDIMLGDKREPIFFRSVTEGEAVRSAEVYARVRILSKHVVDYVPKGECIYTTFPYILKMHGSPAPYMYPFDLKSQADAQERLTSCNYFMVIGISAPQLELPPTYPHEYLQGWTNLVLSSQFVTDGQTTTAGGLFERKRKNATQENPLGGEFPAGVTGGVQ